MPPGPVQIVQPESNNKVTNRRTLANVSNAANVASSQIYLNTDLLSTLPRNVLKQSSCEAPGIAEKRWLIHLLVVSIEGC